MAGVIRFSETPLRSGGLRVRRHLPRQWRQLDQVAGWNKLDNALQNNPPLFYYILRESEIYNAGQHLGPVGSAILMEVLGGMLVHCKVTRKK